MQGNNSYTQLEKGRNINILRYYSKCIFFQIPHIEGISVASFIVLIEKQFKPTVENTNPDHNSY